MAGVIVAVLNADTGSRVPGELPLRLDNAIRRPETGFLLHPCGLCPAFRVRVLDQHLVLDQIEVFMNQADAKSPESAVSFENGLDLRKDRAILVGNRVHFRNIGKLCP